MEKKRAYGDHILNVEKGSFTPSVFTTTGGMGLECLCFNKQLAELISIKTGEVYLCATYKQDQDMFFPETLIAVRGTRGHKPKPSKYIQTSEELIVHSSHEV